MSRAFRWKKLKAGWDWVLVEVVRKINRNTSRGVNTEETGRDTEREKVREATREERRLKQSRDATATQRWHFILTPEQECVASWYLRRKGFSLSLSLSPFNLILSRALYWKLIPPIIIERSEEQPWQSGSEQTHRYLSPPHHHPNPISTPVSKCTPAWSSFQWKLFQVTPVYVVN